MTLVEAHAPSVQHAGRAAVEQALPVAVRTGDAADVLATLRAVDAIVLNPPRRGVAPEVRRAAAASGARAIALVSCEPETLARDLDHLARLGWATESLQPLDMLPQTEEVETVALLKPHAPPPLDVLRAERDLVAVIKPAHAPVTAEDGCETAIVERVRVLPGFDAAEPVSRLDVGTSGVCLLASSHAEAHTWTATLAAPEAEAEVVALVRGVVRERGTLRIRNARAKLRRTRLVAGALVRVGLCSEVRRFVAFVTPLLPRSSGSPAGRGPATRG